MSLLVGNISFIVLVLTSIILSMIYLKNRSRPIYRSIFAAALVGLLIFSMASTSPTFVKALNEITTIATITDFSETSYESVFTEDTAGDPFYEDNFPTEIVATVGTREVTFTDLTPINERDDPNGPYTLVDGAGNTVLFYEDVPPPSDGEAAANTWVLMIPDGSGGTITVPAHDIVINSGGGPVSTEGLYPLVDPSGNPVTATVTFYDPTEIPSDAEAALRNWVLEVVDSQGSTIYVPAHEITLIEDGYGTWQPFTISAGSSLLEVVDWNGETKYVTAATTLFSGQTEWYPLVGSDGGLVTGSVTFYDTGNVPGTADASSQGWKVVYVGSDGTETTVDPEEIRLVPDGLGDWQSLVEEPDLLEVVDWDGNTITVTAATVRTLSSLGPWQPLVDSGGTLITESVTFYDQDNVPSTEDAATRGWYVEIVGTDGSTTYATVQTIRLVPATTVGPFEVDENGMITVTDWDGSERTVTATGVYTTTHEGVEGLFFSLNKPGTSLWIGLGPDEANKQLGPVDGNDIIHYYTDPDTSQETFDIVFDLDDYTDIPRLDIDGASVIRVDGECKDLVFSLDNPNALYLEDGRIVPHGHPDSAFKQSDLLIYNRDTDEIELFWRPADYGVKNPNDIDAVDVGDYDDDGMLEILFSIKSPANNQYPGITGKVEVSDIVLFDYNFDYGSSLPVTAASTFDIWLTGKDDHFDYSGDPKGGGPPDKPPTDIDALYVWKIDDDVDIGQLLLSFFDESFEFGQGDTPPRDTYGREDIIQYDTTARTASMYFDGSNYFWGGGEPQIDAVDRCVGRIVKVMGYAMIFDPQGKTYLFDPQGRPLQYNIEGLVTVNDDQGKPVIFDAQGYAYLFDASGDAYIYDLRGKASEEIEIITYIVKSTTEDPYTETLGPTAQFITCFNYTNTTSTIELKHTTITTEYEVCLDKTTTRIAETGVFTSIVYDSFMNTESTYAPLLLIGLLGFLTMHSLINAKKRKKRNK
jgi:hypothetical protein